MKIKYSHIIYAILGCIAASSSCKRQDDFLNKKQNINQVVPQTLDDFQAIINNTDVMNAEFPNSTNGGADNIIIADASLNSASVKARNIYLWTPNIYQGASSTDWSAGYTIAEYCNIVLDGLKSLQLPSDANSLTRYNNIKGAALFFRTFAFYSLADEYCKPYNNQTASTDLGIVLRLTSDVGEKSVRVTVEQTYNQMISDAAEAAQLLPVNPSVRTLPSQPAAYALLAKIYLSMGDYKNAAIYSTKFLSGFNTLLDFNSNLVKPGANAFPSYPNNPEICFWAYGTGDAINDFYAGNASSAIDATFYNSYDDNDLRKSCFYAVKSGGGHKFVSSYQGSLYPFAGIATNEILLIQAESYARTGNANGALADLNSLLVKRYKSGTYVPLTITDPTALLSKILLERRKELPFTGQLRWEDLRRLNQDPNYAVTLTRTYKGVTYTLPPNDPKYVFPIPDNEIQLSGIQQNPR